MRAPHFLRLAEIDDQHFITACRHGLVHLTWERSTVRLTRDEFRRLAGLLERATDGLPPIVVRDGELGVTFRAEDDCEFQLGSLLLLLSPTELQEFARTAREAVRRLDKILASGIWDKEEPEDAPFDLSERPGRNPFSNN